MESEFKIGDWVIPTEKAMRTASVLASVSRGLPGWVTAFRGHERSVTVKWSTGRHGTWYKERFDLYLSPTQEDAAYYEAITG